MALGPVGTRKLGESGGWFTPTPPTPLTPTAEESLGWQAGRAGEVGALQAAGPRGVGGHAEGRREARSRLRGG